MTAYMLRTDQGRPYSDDDCAKVERRRQLRCQSPDVLAQRARTVAQIDARMLPCWYFYRGVFKNLLLPSARAAREARDRRKKFAWLADMEAAAARSRQAKARRKAAMGPQALLFGAEA